MNLTAEIPGDLAGQLNAADGDLSRRALEALALEEYTSGHITKAELRRFLGFSTRYELDGFLKAHEVRADYTIDDLRRELEDLKNPGLRRCCLRRRRVGLSMRISRRAGGRRCGRKGRHSGE
jgi:hypothetical protein